MVLGGAVPQFLNQAAKSFLLGPANGL